MHRLICIFVVTMQQSQVFSSQSFTRGRGLQCLLLFQLSHLLSCIYYMSLKSPWNLPSTCSFYLPTWNQNSMWYTDWRQAGRREAQANMEETDRQTAVSGRSRQLTLKKGEPGDQVLDMLCMQLASYLERGQLMWMMPLHLHIKNLIMIYI